MNNVDKMFEDLKLQGFSYIENLIKEQQEENLFLDFKRKCNADAPYMDRDDRKNYAKALSAFSNASGGLIIWGVEARSLKEHSPDVAVGVKPISHLRKFVTDLNSLTHSALIPVNNQVQNIPIFVDKRRDIGIAVTYIPESDVYPHRALLGVHQYYTRAGDSFIVMEHHLLEESFGKKYKPKMNVKFSTSLEVNNDKKNKSEEEDKDEKVYLHFNFSLQNVGKYLSKYPALKLKNNNKHLKVKFKQYAYELHNSHLNEVKISHNEYYYISNQNLVIHPSMTIPVVRVTIKISKEKLEELFEQNYVFSFGYEVYSQNCEPIMDTIYIKARTIQNRYKRYFK